MASYAAAIRDETGLEPQLEKGKRGQFDVLVNDKIVIARKGGLLAKITGKPWPEVGEVVAAVVGGLAS